MSIETLLQENTDAANRLADLLEKQGGGAAAKPAAGTKPAAKTPAKTPAKPKVTFEEVKTAVIAVKDNIDEDAAKAILVEHGGKGSKLATIQNKPETWAAILASCAEAMDGAGEPEAEPDEDDGI